MRDRTSTIHVRLPRDVQERAQAAADERGLSLTFLVSRLVAEGLERLVPVDELRFTRPRPLVERPDPSQCSECGSPWPCVVHGGAVR